MDIDLREALALLERADDAGAGGKQRELVLLAIEKLAIEYRTSMETAGNDTYVVTSILRESVLS